MANDRPKPEARTTKPKFGPVSDGRTAHPIGTIDAGLSNISDCKCLCSFVSRLINNY